MDKKVPAEISAFCVSAFCFILALAPVQSSGQDSKEIELEKIIVTNRRSPSSLSEATENVAVVGEEEISELPAKNLGEALEYIPGVDIERGSGFGRPASISIQGSDPRHVRVMIDGIPLNTQVSEMVDPSRFPLEDIARIEVIKGASSSMWGSGLGGVINIITKDTGETLIPKGSLTTSVAEFRTRKESGELSGKLKELGYYLFSSYMESGGKGPKDDVLEKKGFGKVSYDLKDMGKIIASFGYSGADVNSGEFPDGSWWAQPYRIRYGKVGWSLDTGDKDFSIDLKNSRQDIITKTFFSVDDVEPFSIIRFKDALYQLSLNASTHVREEDLLVLGVDSDWDSIKSDPYLAEAKSLASQAPYANYTLKLEPWDLNFGLRYDRNSEFGSQLSPSWGLNYKFNSPTDTRIHFTASRAFNAPLLIWKYNENAAWFTAPNPAIRAERAWVYELGLESKPLSRLWVEFSLYRADVRDAIARARDETGLIFMKNFEKFRRQGAELQGRIKLLEGLDFFASGAFNDIEDRATKKTVRGGGRPRQSFDAGFEYKNKHGFNISLKGYYDRWNEEAAVFFNKQGEEVTVDPNDRKMLVDVKISQEIRYLTLFFNMYNLNNSKYWQDFFFPTPKRYFEGGVTVKW